MYYRQSPTKYNRNNIRIQLFLFLGFLASFVAADFPLTKLPSSTPIGGKCMDGTPAGFYISKGSNPSLFVVKLEGGGGCTTKADCDSRAKSHLGSSNYFEPSLSSASVSGLLNTNCQKNPDFCEGTNVYVPYCTGDHHVGTRSEPSAETWGYYFDGHHNFVAIIDMLVSKYGLGDATHILLTGASAGAIGALYHVDYLADRFPSATVKGAPVAGWFMPGALPSDLPSIYPPSDYQHFSSGTHGNPYYDGQAGSVNLWGDLDLLPQACIDDFGEENKQACKSMDNRYKYIKSPLYIIQTQYDSCEIFQVGGAPERPTTNELETTKAYIEMMGEASRVSLKQIMNDTSLTKKKQSDGLFAASCLHHGTPLNVEINGYRWIELVNDWFYEKNKLQTFHQMVETCSYEDGEKKLPCNVADECLYGGGSNPTPNGASCRSGLMEKGCTSSPSEHLCLVCAFQNKKFLMHKGCTVDVAREACSELDAPDHHFSDKSYDESDSDRKDPSVIPWGKHQKRQTKQSRALLYITLLACVSLLIVVAMSRSLREISAVEIEHTSASYYVFDNNEQNDGENERMIIQQI